MKKIYRHPIYPVLIYIYIGLDDKKFTKELKKDSKGRASDEFIKSLCADNALACVNSYMGHIVVRFKPKKPSHDLVVHETLHATRCIMDYVGIHMSESTEEAWAYTQQDLFNQITKRK